MTQIFTTSGMAYNVRSLVEEIVLLISKKYFNSQARIKTKMNHQKNFGKSRVEQAILTA